MLEDKRGRFVKLFHSDFFSQHQLVENFEEQYYSTSKSRVLRGLHFQVPPHGHVKVVTCISGEIVDVVFDLRKKSTTYGQFISVELSSEKANLLYVPEGLAHGFYVMSEQATFLSLNSRKFSAECDAGIRWDSIGFEWPDPEPIVSEKDRNMIGFQEFVSPF